MAVGNDPDISIEAAVVGIVDELEPSQDFRSQLPAGFPGGKERGHGDQ
jgi:hypothetical protein